MKQVVIGLIVVATGIGIAVYRNQFVDYIARLNNGGLGFLHYGKTEKTMGLGMAWFFSVFLTVLGILILVGLFKLK